jgi:hypothetical protein
MNCIIAEQMITPYIKWELTDQELADFLKHIDTCKECREELEIYFTIHFALLQLENEQQSPMNISEMLKQNLKSRKQYLVNKRRKKLGMFIVVAAAQLLIVSAIFTQVEIWNLGNVELTSMYRFRKGYFNYPFEHMISIDGDTVRVKATDSEIRITEESKEVQTKDEELPETKAEEMKPHQPETTVSETTETNRAI